MRPWASSGAEAISGQFFTVIPMDLEVKINKDGELQAVSYTDIKSEVESVTQIITIVPEGVNVKKGDVLITLDSLTLRQKKEQLDLDLRKAESARKQSQDMKDIQESQNAANIEAADVAVELAELDVQQYYQGTYPQSVENAKTALAMAKLTLKNVEEDLDQTKVLFGKGFVTASDVKKGELAVTTSRNDVLKATTALTVLENAQGKHQHAQSKDRRSGRKAAVLGFAPAAGAQIGRAVGRVHHSRPGRWAGDLFIQHRASRARAGAGRHTGSPVAVAAAPAGCHSHEGAAEGSGVLEAAS
jgi:multidrug efflux pump subunit AcrA (membrane-fusion protein)